MSVPIDPNTGEEISAPVVPKPWPTGKQHISFSELATWMDCAYRHKLLNIDKLGEFTESPHASFGTSIHASSEIYLNTRVMDKEPAFKIIRDTWARNPSFVEGPFPDWSPEGFGVVDDWIKMADRILDEIPAFLDKNFPGWKCKGAEENLYEPIEGQQLRFKGIVDGVLEFIDKRGKLVYWIIDWKTCGWGWRKDQKQDFKKQLQLILYKHFWCKKHGVALKDVRCAFGLLKRDGKPGKSIELLPVSVGPKTEARGLKVVNNHISAVKRGFFLKNREACRFCEFADTVHCPQNM